LATFGRSKWSPLFAAACILAVLSLGASGCSVSFCAGSGCDSGKIFFGKHYKQSGGSISVVDKSSSFKLGESVAMVANLNQNAGSTNLTLKVSHGGKSQSFPYHVTSTKDNIEASLFSPATLASLGVTSAGSYTFEMLRGSKQLAKGSMTES